MIGKSETIFPALPTMKTYQPVRSDRHEKTLIALFLFSTLPVQATGLSEKRANRPRSKFDTSILRKIENIGTNEFFLKNTR